MRGGNASGLTILRRKLGSSPLARGKRLTPVINILTVRIIPACAGETSDAAGRVLNAADHPRLRGGNLEEFGGSVETFGSSPLARGKLSRSMPLRSRSRIIPACAGETQPRHPTQRAGADHPRLRGGNPSATVMTARARGSSPLARGKHGRGHRRRRGLRIIPACAGETAASGGRRPWVRDHPRLRGGNPDAGVEGPLWLGSSPLARGKLSPSPVAAVGARIIPACAGETRTTVTPACRRSDHPRLRGGN